MHCCIWSQRKFCCVCLASASRSGSIYSVCLLKPVWPTMKGQILCCTKVMCRVCCLLHWVNCLFQACLMEKITFHDQLISRTLRRWFLKSSQLSAGCTGLLLDLGELASLQLRSASLPFSHFWAFGLKICLKMMAYFIFFIFSNSIHSFVRPCRSICQLCSCQTSMIQHHTATWYCVLAHSITARNFKILLHIFSITPW